MATSDAILRMPKAEQDEPKKDQTKMPKWRQIARSIRDDSSTGRGRRRVLGRSHSLTVADWAGKWKEAFGLFDKDKDGLISGQELASEMGRLGMPTEDGEVEQLLNQWDTDSKGALTLLEFTSLMNSSRCSFVSASTAARLHNPEGQQQSPQQQSPRGRPRHRLCCQTSEDGALNTEELLELRAAFDLFDQDGDGVLNREEVRSALELLEEEATDEDVDLVMSEADANGNGSLSFREFCGALQNGAGGGGALFPGKSTYQHRSAGDSAASHNSRL